MQYSAIQLKATATAVPALRATAIVVRAGGVVATLKLMAETTAAALAMAVAAPQLSMAVQAQLLKAAAVTGYFLKFLELTDQAAFSDATAYRLQRALDDLAEIADVAHVTTGKGLADSAVLSEANVLQVVKGLADAVGFADTLVMGMSRHLDEAVYLDDPIGKKFATRRSDGFTVDEGPGYEDYASSYFLEEYAHSGRPAIQVGKGFTDPAGQFSDRINYINVVKGLTEQITLTETFARHMRRTLTDSLTATDDIDGNLATDDEQNMQYRKAVTDVFTAGDSVFLLVSFVRTPNDTASLSDTPVVRTAKALADAGTASEQLVARVRKVLADTAAASDAAALAIAKAFADSGTASDAAKVLTNKGVSDAAAMIDAARANMTKVLADTTGISEDKLFALSKPLSDSGTASDAAAKSFSTAKADSASITDAGAVRMQSYCDITYFAQDYVGTSFTF